jgi:SmpA / OmlA family
MRYLSIALVLILVLAVGCAKTIEGKKIDGAKTKELLAPGTNESKVVQMFGEPQQKETLPSGETKYIYYYREARKMLWSTNPKDQQRLEVFFKDNMVQRYRYVYNEEEPITRDIPPIQPEKK